jgi:hypothetical protein
MFSKKTFVVVSMAVASLVAACGSNGGNGNTGGNGGSGGDGGGHTSSTSSKYTCCINDKHYRCPDKAAFDKCAGFDIDACMQACAPSDFMCPGSCFDQAANATNDPSSCQEDPSVQCGGSGGGGPVGSCVGDWDGSMCDYDADCTSNNCFDNKCYGNDVGNPCEYDADCTSNNCYQNCCYDNSKGSPCEYDADCTSNNCYDNVCQ